MHRTLQQPSAKGTLDLTDRDKLWLRAANRFRFVTTDQAELLSGSMSRRAMNRRLAQLWAHDYLDRPEIQKKAYAFEKKRHTVHVLGPKGARWLQENDGVEFPKRKGWKIANALKSSEHLKHRIGVTDMVLRFEAATQDREGLRLIHQDELIALHDWPVGLKKHR